MRRVVYEWGFLFAAALAICCFGYWAFSISSDTADFPFYLPLSNSRALQLTAYDGTLIIFDNYGSLGTISVVIDQKLTAVPPPVTTNNVMLPGFHFRRIVWPGGRSTDWSFEISFLPIGLFFVAIAALCFYNLRAVLRKRLGASALQ